MALLAITANCVTVPFQLNLGVPTKTIIDHTLDLITVAVPPALPAAMSCGIVFALRRLKLQGQIFCISPPRVNMAGQIETFVFDKTGTLTEEGLSVYGFCPTAVSQVYDGSETGQTCTIFTEFCTSAASLATTPNGYDTPCRGSNRARLLEAMASCAAVTYVDGELVGDPLDIAMFKSTGWVLDESAAQGGMNPD